MKKKTNYLDAVSEMNVPSRFMACSRIAFDEDPVQSYIIHQTPTLFTIMWKLLPDMCNWARTRGQTCVSQVYFMKSNVLSAFIFLLRYSFSKGKLKSQMKSIREDTLWNWLLTQLISLKILANRLHFFRLQNICKTTPISHKFWFIRCLTFPVSKFTCIVWIYYISALIYILLSKCHIQLIWLC